MTQSGISRIRLLAVLLGVGLALAVGSSAGAQSPPPTPADPTAIARQADQLLVTAKAQFQRGDMQGVLASNQQALILYRTINDRSGQAIALANIGEAYGAIGQYEAGLQAYQQSLSLRRALRDAAGEASVLNGMGQIYHELGRPQLAMESYQQARAIWRGLGDQLHEAWALGNIAIVYSDLGQQQPALDLYQQALGIYRRLGARRDEGITLVNIGKTYEETGQYRLALENYQQALPIMREAGSKVNVGTTLNNIANAYRLLAEYEQAAEFYQQALSIRRDVGDRSGEASTLGDTGTLYRHLGQYDRALDLYQQALGIYREIGRPAGQAVALRSIGVVHGNHGQYQQALQAYEQALTLLRQVGDRRTEGITLGDIGDVYVDVAQYERALEYYQQALAIAREVGASQDEAGVLANMAAVFRHLGQHDQALAYLQQSLPITREIGARANEAASLQMIGVVYDETGQQQRALDAYQQALVLARQIGNRSAEGKTLISLGVVHDALGQTQQALSEFQEALVIAREVGDPSDQRTALRNLGLHYQEQGRLDDALLSYQQAITVGESLRAGTRVEELQTSLAGTGADLYELASLVLQQLGRSQEAFEIAERGRSRTFLDQLGNVRPDPRRSGDPQLAEREQDLRTQLAALDQQLRGERAKPSAQRSEETVRALRTRLDETQRAYEQALTQLKLSSPDYAALVSVSPLSLAQVQQQLPPDTTLVSYLVTQPALQVFVLTRDTFQAVTVPAGRAQIKQAVDRFRAATSPDTSAQDVAELSNWLVLPLQRYMTTPTILVAPHDVLHYVPFAALRDGDRYLGETHRLVMLPSASVLPFIQGHRKPLTGDVLAVAQSQAPGLPLLRFAAQEAQAIAKLAGTTPLVDAEATDAAVRRQAGEHAVLHLAAHGELNADRPLLSRILLAPAPDGADDGSLTVQDVYGLDLAKTDLVVLSACETNLGAQSAGDDIVGLNRAFLYAGASSVVASLWKVDDEATSVFMTAFYRSLKQGQSKAEALQSAQAKTRAQYPSPYYWAAFVLTGDPGLPTSAAQPAGGTPSGRTAFMLGGVVAAALVVGTTGWLGWRRRTHAHTGHTRDER
jgi:CHAT domain-containing protein/Tfp pilus assembly protein PilF